MSAVLALSPVLDLRAAAGLKTDLLAFRGRPVRLDASAVERLGGLCLQVLLAARKTWAEDGQALTLTGEAEAFQDQWAAFGAPAFEIDATGASA